MQSGRKELLKSATAALQPALHAFEEPTLCICMIFG